MRVREVMTANPCCCLPGATARDSAILMKKHDTGILPVVKDEKSRELVGVVTDRDLCLDVIADAHDPKSARVEASMARQLVCCRPADDLNRVLDLMRD